MPRTSEARGSRAAKSPEQRRTDAQESAGFGRPRTHRRRWPRRSIRRESGSLRKSQARTIIRRQALQRGEGYVMWVAANLTVDMRHERQDWLTRKKTKSPAIRSVPLELSQTQHVGGCCVSGIIPKNNIQNMSCIQCRRLGLCHQPHEKVRHPASDLPKEVENAQRQLFAHGMSKMTRSRVAMASNFWPSSSNS